MRIALFVQNRDFFSTRLIQLPLLDALRGAAADTRLVVYAPYRSTGLFRVGGLADEVRHYRHGIFRLRAELRRENYDLIVSLRPQSAWLNLAIGSSGAARRAGYRGPLAGPLFTHLQARDSGIYRATSYLRLAEALGLGGSLDGVFLRLAASAEAERGVLPNALRYCLMPGGGESRRWGMANFLALAAWLAREEPAARFDWVLGDDERDYPALIGASPLAARSRLLYKAGIGEVAQSALASRAVVANDCGPAHIAQMLARPTVMIFSDHDRDAATRSAEWFNPQPRARLLCSAPGADIKSVPVAFAHAAVGAVREL